MAEEYSYSKVLEIKESRKQGKLEKKFLVKWDPTYVSASFLGKSESELCKDFVIVEVLGPVDSKENKAKNDSKKMIWGIKKINKETARSEVSMMPFDELRRNYPEELSDYLMQFVTV